MNNNIFTDKDGNTVMAIISKKHGRFLTLISPEDVDKIDLHKWYVYRSSTDPDLIYFRAHNRVSKSEYKKLELHRFIMDAPQGLIVDHRNPHDTLDNRRSNLRLATPQQSMWNTRSRKGSSKFKGVSFCKSTNSWGAYIRINGKKKRLYYGSSEIKAARAYDAAAREYHGEFAVFNFPSHQRAEG